MAKLDNVSDVFANASVTTQSTSVAAGNLVIPTGDLPRFNQGNNVAEGAEVVYALLAAMHSAVNAAGNTNSSVSAGVNNTFNSSALTMTREFSFNTTLDLSAKLDDFDVKLDPGNIVPNTTIAVDPASFSYAKDTHNNTTNISTVTVTSDGANVAPSQLGSDFSITATSSQGTWEVVDDGSDNHVLRLTSHAAVANATYAVVVSLNDLRLGFDQTPAVTAQVNVTIADS